MTEPPSHALSPRTAVAAVLLTAVLLAPAGPVSAQAPELSWSLDPAAFPPPSTPDCQAPEAAVLACGTWGDYRLGGGPPPGTACGPAIAGSEPPSPYAPSSWPEPEPAEWFPCREGECFTEDGAGPWVAVVDWDDEHGWSVAHTVLQAADFGVGVRLFALDRPPAPVAPVLGGFAVGDGHLLAQLCALAETIEQDPANPPLAVNLSAGRHLEGGAPAPGAPPSLAGQVAALIDHLTSEHGVAFVASAGHHRELLFPALLPRVVAVGNLNLAKHRYTGELWPSWQAARETVSLFPGHGLDLAPPGASGECWPLPAGSSFAAATAAGWIAAYRAAGGGWIADDAEAAWAPIEHDGRLHLARNGSWLAGTDLTGPAALVGSALGATACNTAPATAERALTVGSAIPNPLQGRPSLVEMVDEIGPSPENEPCVPCDIQAAGLQEPRLLRVGLSHPLAPDYRLVDLFLVTNGVFHPLEAPDKTEILAGLESAELAAVELVGFDQAHLQPWHEALLVLVLGTGDDELWSSVPIDVLP